MLRTKPFWLVLVLLAACSAASASIVVSTDISPGPMPDTNTVTLRVSGNVSVLEARFSGPMYQVWGSGGWENAWYDPAMAPGAAARDSHLLIGPGDVVAIVRDVHEDGPGTMGLSESLGSWLGNSSNARFSVQIAVPAPTLTLAQFVMPVGASLYYDIMASAAGSALETKTGYAYNGACAPTDGGFGFLAGAEYTLPINGQVTLNVPTPEAASYEWDLDQDLVRELTGKSPTLTWYNALRLYGLQPGTDYTMWVKGTRTSDGLVGWQHVTLHVPLPEPASLSLLAVAGLAALRRRR